MLRSLGRIPKASSASTQCRFASGRVFIANGKRTPFGKFGGSLKDITPVDLTVLSAKAALEESKISAADIDHVIFANVVPSTTDTIYAARHVALKLGAKIETPAYNLNRLCGSGIQALVDAKHMILRGEANVVLACGAENMSMIPHLTYGTRFGSRLESFKVVDMLTDALSDAYTKTPMAVTAENLGSNYSVTRAEVDQYSFESHQKGALAYKNGHLQGELTPITLKKTKVEADEHLRPDAQLADMVKLKSLFKENGLVTAGTASGIVDGAASLIVVSEEYLNKHGLTPLAEVGDYAVVGVDPNLMGCGPIPAIRKLMQKTGLTIKDFDLVEVNEAFAAQVLAVAKDLNLDLAKLNIWGGAIALGHPLGASGLRIALTLARQLKVTGGKQGVASACIGGGQGIALHVKSV